MSEPVDPADAGPAPAPEPQPAFEPAGFVEAFDFSDVSAQPWEVDRVEEGPAGSMPADPEWNAEAQATAEGDNGNAPEASDARPDAFADHAEEPPTCHAESPELAAHDLPSDEPETAENLSNPGPNFPPPRPTRACSSSRPPGPTSTPRPNSKPRRRSFRPRPTRSRRPSRCPC
ncbi:MAG: hypothetical protein U0835_03285 [Isosphaeraceae bacterium]